MREDKGRAKTTGMAFIFEAIRKCASDNNIVLRARWIAGGETDHNHLADGLSRLRGQYDAKRLLREFNDPEPEWFVHTGPNAVYWPREFLPRVTTFEEVEFRTLGADVYVSYVL